MQHRAQKGEASGAHLGWVDLGVHQVGFLLKSYMWATGAAPPRLRAFVVFSS